VELFLHHPAPIVQASFAATELSAAETLELERRAAEVEDCWHRPEVDVRAMCEADLRRRLLAAEADLLALSGALDQPVRDDDYRLTAARSRRPQDARLPRRSPGGATSRSRF
jgi:hypothetical protein